MRLGLAIVGGIAFLVAAPVACVYLNSAQNVATAPARVTSRVAQTENILGNYRAFFDINGQYNARVAQIAERNGLLAAETDRAEQQRLRIELSATRQSCRDLAQRYNNDAQRQDAGRFRDANLPATLDASACER